MKTTPTTAERGLIGSLKGSLHELALFAVAERGAR